MEQQIQIEPHMRFAAAGCQQQVVLNSIYRSTDLQREIAINKASTEKKA